MKFRKRSFLSMICSLCLGIIFSATSATMVLAKDLYVSPTGNDSVSYANNDIDHPWKTPGKAVSDALSGDTAYFRGGNYTLTSMLTTVNTGSEGSPITLKNYADETPTITGNGLSALLLIEDQYWILDGITFTIQNASQAVIRVGYDNSAHHTTIQNCTLHMISYVAGDNIACVKLLSGVSHYALIENNYMQGPGSSISGVTIVGSTNPNVGTKILNSKIWDCGFGVFVKHANGDTSLSSGAEIAYNYIHDCGHGLYGSPVYINIHDNLLSNCDSNFGNNAGGPQGHDCTLNHNTMAGIELQSPGEGPVQDFNITNNIFHVKTCRTYNGDSEAAQTWDYNMYGDDVAIGAHDIGTTLPIFTGGTSPSTISGYALTAGSPGYHAASDGKDMGADISLVGPGGSSPPGVPGDPPWFK